MLMKKNDIHDQVNDILQIGSCEAMIIDVRPYLTEAKELVEEIGKISKSNNAKVIVYAPGYHVRSNIVSEFLEAGYFLFVLSSIPSVRKDQLEKCLNGYYEKNGIQELKDLEIEREEKKQEYQKIQTDMAQKTIAVAGVMHRIGTTTQAVQLVKYLMLQGHKACYVQSNGTDYIQRIMTYYECEIEKDLGKIVFENVDMYYDIDKIGTILSLDYDYYVYDYGCMFDTSFNKLSFLERYKRIVVCGVKPNEIEFANKLIQHRYYSDLYYIFSFVDENTQKNILELMEDLKSHTYFSGYIPDPFVYDPSSDFYKEIMPVECLNTEKGSKVSWIEKFRGRKR